MELLEKVVEIAREAGERLLKTYSAEARPKSRTDMYTFGRQIEGGNSAYLEAALRELRPGAGWVTDEMEGSDLPAGEWWATDGIEGGVNHVHGLPEWSVNITLFRDNVPVLTVVRMPVPDLTYTAVRGEGAFLDGVRLRVSEKRSLDAAVVTASQAPGSPDANRRFGDAVAALMGVSLLVRNTIPTTFPLLAVASGQYDVFWQYEPDLPGVAAGALLVSEAGGTVTDLRGEPWRPGSADVLIAAPGLHEAARAVLNGAAS
ncbi:inositol monophosphatase family protein [Streptomyces sp. 900105755]